jgi:hypothetical protein
MDIEDILTTEEMLALQYIGDETVIQSGQAEYFMTAHDLVIDLGRAYREGRCMGRAQKTASMVGESSPPG